MTVVRKRHVLTGMKYDRVDLVGEGANGHADILIAKNRKPQTNVAKKAMGTYQCQDCGANQKGITKSRACISCDSENLNYVEVTVSKKVTPVGAKQTNPQQAKTKKVPSNDDATNAGQYTFEDQQYDQDNGENGQALGDAVERSVLNKSQPNWFEVDVNKSDYLDYNPEQDKDGRDVGNVDNMKDEHMKEGEQNDEEQERLAEKQPTGLRPDRETGYLNTDTKTHASMMATHKSRNFDLGKKRTFKKEKPGRNSWDYGDQGSQEVAESAEQMFRSNSQPTPEAQSRQDSTRSKVVVKARRKRTNREGLDIIDHTSDGNAQGIYSQPGVKRNGTGTGHNKYTNKPRTAVAPPGNPNDVGKRVVKSIDLASLEALNLGVQFAENMNAILKSNRPEAYNELMADFVETVNAVAGEWFVGSSITKSKNADAQANDIAQRALAIISKASPAAEASDDAAQGEDADEVDKKSNNNAVGKLKTSYPGNNKNEKEQTVVGKKKIFKSLQDNPYEGFPEEVMKKFAELDELKEERAQQVYLSKARELRGLPGYNEEKVAKQLRDAYEADAEGGEYLFQTLSAAANVAHDSTIFKQFGLPGSGADASDPMAKARAYAQSHVTKGANGPSEDVLMAEYIKEHGAEFYAEAKK